MESLFREHFEAPRRPSVAADGCEIIQRAFSAPSAPACPWLCSKADTDLGDYCTDGDLQTNEIVSGAAPSVQASAGRQQRPMAPVPLSDFSRARAFHPPAPAAASQAFPPPVPRMKSARGFSPNPPLGMQNPGSCCFGASPSRLLPPALHQTSRLRGGAGRERHQRHLAWLHALLTLLRGSWASTKHLHAPTQPPAGARSPLLGALVDHFGSSWAHTDAGGTAGRGDIPHRPAGSSTPHRRHCRGGGSVPSNERPYRGEGWRKQSKDNACCFNAKRGEDGC